MNIRLLIVSIMLVISSQGIQAGIVYRVIVPFAEFFGANFFSDSLCEAIRKRDMEEITKQLGVVNVNISDRDGRSPMHWAVASGDVKIVKKLYENGAAVDRSMKIGQTPLFWAVCEGNFDVAKFLIEKGAGFDGSIAGDGQTALHVAADHDDCKMAEYLISKRADVNKVNKHGDTPLMFAARKGSKNVVSLFIKSNADLEKEDSWGETALTNGIMNLRGSSMMDLLIDFGANLNLKNTTHIHNKGTMPLDLIVFRHTYDQARYAINRGAQFGNKNKFNLSASLRVLAYYQLRKKIIADAQKGVFIKKEIEALKKENINRTPVWESRMITSNGESITHMAARKSTPEILDLLTIIGVEPLNDKNQTPLEAAVESENFETANYLLTKRGANPYRHDDDKNTMWQRAARENKTDVLKFITKYQIDKLKREDEPECSICFEDLNNNNVVLSLCDYQCLRLICTDCKSMLPNQKCPTCDIDLSLEFEN